MSLIFLKKCYICAGIHWLITGLALACERRCKARGKSGQHRATYFLTERRAFGDECTTASTTENNRKT